MSGIEQLKGKELLDTLEALRTHSPSNSKSITRILYNRYGNAHTRNYFLLIDRETQTRNWTKHSNTSYQISDGRMYRPWANITTQGISYPPKRSTKRRPRKSFHNTNHINIKEINYHHNQIIIIILNYERIYISHQQTQFKSELIILQG